MINIPYVIAIPKVEGDKGYFLFLKVECVQKFRTKKARTPNWRNGLNFKKGYKLLCKSAIEKSLAFKSALLTSTKASFVRSNFIARVSTASL